MRTCVVSHEKLMKKDLLRVVRTPEGDIVVDLSGKANGRGAYLKKDSEVIEKARKTRTLDQILETPIPDEIYDEMQEKIK